MDYKPNRYTPQTLFSRARLDVDEVWGLDVNSAACRPPARYPAAFWRMTARLSPARRAFSIYSAPTRTPLSQTSLGSNKHPRLFKLACSPHTSASCCCNLAIRIALLRRDHVKRIRSAWPSFYPSAPYTLFETTIPLSDIPCEAHTSKPKLITDQEQPKTSSPLNDVLLDNS